MGTELSNTLMVLFTFGMFLITLLGFIVTLINAKK